MYLHASRRAGHFFSFLFFLQAACDVAQARTGQVMQASGMVGRAATHQIDTGLNMDADHEEFDSGDATVIDRYATTFTRTDAAHFCNLGLIGSFARLQQMSAGDADLGFLVSMCETLAGDTVQLPKKVNIGPDRVIDRLHYEMATEMLSDGRRIFDSWRTWDYAGRAQQAMTDYVVSERGKNKFGTAACGDCYVRAYDTLVLDIDDSTRTVIRAECEALGLPSARFLD